MGVGSININDRINTPAEEAYRALRTNIQFCAVNGRLRTLTVTSTNPNEGKTTTTLNLSVSFAKSGMKVLLVDADLRKAMMSRDSILQDTVGLSSFLSGMAEFEDTVRKTNVENLSITSCGPKPPNPAELLGTDRFGAFLNTACDNFDLVIFDTPPLGSVIDSAIVAAQTDGTVLVVEANAVEYRNVQKVKEQLEKANAKIYGVVLNKLKKSEYKSYYNYYNYAGSSRNRKK